MTTACSVSGPPSQELESGQVIFDLLKSHEYPLPGIDSRLFSLRDRQLYLPPPKWSSLRRPSKENWKRRDILHAVHDLYSEPKYEEFRPRTVWSLSNAFTSAFKELDPISQFKTTAKLGEFLEARFSQSF